MSQIITIPHNWTPYSWQQEVLDALDEGIKRICIVAHRRAGKDALALNLAAIQAHKKVGTYVHAFPQAVQGRKALWRGADDEGVRFTEQAFPLEIRKTTRDQEMSIEFLNGSIWQCIGADNPNALVGSNPQGIVFSEYALFPDDTAWNLSRPILTRNGGWAVFISTFRGRNHHYELYQKNKNNPEWLCLNLDVTKTFDLGGNPLVSPEAIEAERAAGMPESIIRQEFYNDPTASFSGAYYGQMMGKANAEKRIGDFLWDSEAPVFVGFDIGYSDHTVAVFFQVVEPNKTVIIGSKAWQFTTAADIAQDIKQSFPWGNRINVAILPWDAAKPGPGGETWAGTFDAYGIGTDEIVVLRKGMGTLHNEIAHVQQHLSTCYFDNVQRPWTAEKLNNGKLIEALTGYRTERIARSPGVFSKNPYHSWESHYADAVRTALVYRYGDYMTGNWGPKPSTEAADRAMGWTKNGHLI